MAQDWSVNALVYFYSAGSDLPWAVFYWRLDMELTDMTQEDIIRMAREANASFETAESMFKFAALVAAAEREACAKLCDDHWNKSIDCGDKAGALQCVGIRTAIRAREQA